MIHFKNMARYFGRIYGLMGGFTLGYGDYRFILAGVILGWIMDVMIIPRLLSARKRDEFDQQYAMALIRVFAQLAKADGFVTTREVSFFKNCLKFRKEDEGVIGAIFNEARVNSTQFTVDLQIIAELKHNDPETLKRITIHLYQMALLEGGVHPNQAAILRASGAIFDLSQDFIEGLEQGLGLGEEVKDDLSTSAIGDESPYHILGLSPGTHFKMVKTQYRQLIQRVHPDRLKSQGASNEEIKAAEDQMARFNAAYDVIKAKQKK